MNSQEVDSLMEDKILKAQAVYNTFTPINCDAHTSQTNAEFGMNVEPISQNSASVNILHEETERAEDLNCGCCRTVFPFGFCYEFTQLIRMAIPITATSLIAFSTGPISLIFCGRLGKTDLATAGLANSVFNVVGLSIIFGMLTAVDTFFSQTYGSPYKYMMGIHLQRALVIMSLCCIPSWSLYICIEPILLALKQNPLISKKVSNYLVYMIPGLYFASVSQVFTKYAQTQNRVYVPLLIGVLSMGINVLLHYILLFIIEVGVEGSAVAQSTTYALQCFAYLPYVLNLGRSEGTWTGLSRELWLDWGMWFKLAMPGVVMLTLEWTIFEIGSIVSGTLGEKELATQAILLNLETTCYTLLPLGFGIATSIRVGQFLGAGSSLGPISVISVALVTLWSAAAIVTLVIILLRYELAKIFTSATDIIELTAQLLPFIAAFQIFDGTVGVCSGAIRGAGLQYLGAIVCFVTLYLIGAPFGLVLVFVAGNGLEGLWTGMVAGTILEAISYLVICRCIDWPKQVQLALKRTSHGCENQQQYSITSERSNQSTISTPGFPILEATEVQLESHNSITADINSLLQSSNILNNSEATSPVESGQSKYIHLKKCVLRRLIFISCMLLVLVASLTLRITKVWSLKNGIYCMLSNGTVLSINNSTLAHLPNINDQELTIQFGNDNCTLYLV